MKQTVEQMIADFYQRCPELISTRDTLTASVAIVIKVYSAQRKVLAAGCGGSMADAEHITGELLKSFRRKRPLPESFQKTYHSLFGEDETLHVIEGSLPAICLTGNAAVMTAVMNDLGGDYAFAQTAMGLANPGDVLIAISTSGNSRLLIPAVKVAKAKGAHVILFTGGTGGALKSLADVAVIAPVEETYLIQEMHVKLYHLLCAAVEEEFFSVLPELAKNV